MKYQTKIYYDRMDGYITVNQSELQELLSGTWIDKISPLWSKLLSNLNSDMRNEAIEKGWVIKKSALSDAKLADLYL